MENEEGKGPTEPRGENSPAEAVVEAEGEEDLVEAALEAEGLEYKGVLSRLLAFVIDIIVLILIAAIIGTIFGPDSTMATYLPLAVGFIYFVGFWSLRGQTPGKMVVRAKIVKADGSPISFSSAILRYLFYLIPSFAPILFFAGLAVDMLPLPVAIVAFIIILVSRRKQGLHDMIAGTYVVDSRPTVLEPYTDEED